MGQHLHLYASKHVTVAEVSKWCHARAHELMEVPSAADKPIVDKVQQEMDRLQRWPSLSPNPEGGNHLEHWSNWCGVEIWGFLVWKPRVCDAKLVERAVESARVAMRYHEGVQQCYPGRDFTQDDVITFLRAHQGAVVWGDNDGV